MPGDCRSASHASVTSIFGGCFSSTHQSSPLLKIRLGAAKFSETRTAPHSSETPMETSLQLCYPVLTLEGEELLPAGAHLTKGTMEALVRSAKAQNYPAMRLMDYGTIASDLQRICQKPFYRNIFSDPVRTKDVFETMQRVTLPQPLLEIYRYFRTHDPYDYWHILTVFALSLLLAQDLIDDRKELAREVAASPSHDFGKICVPLEILTKQTPLTVKEQERLSHHPAAGYVILSYYLGDPEHPAAITARDHHERANGSGYPGGARLQNRIVEIVACGDVFDALISQRPYRPHSYDLRSALEEISLQAEQGAFSTDVVHALISHCRKSFPGQQMESEFSHERRGTSPAGNLYQGARLCRFESGCGEEDEEA